MNNNGGIYLKKGAFRPFPPDGISSRLGSRIKLDLGLVYKTFSFLFASLTLVHYVFARVSRYGALPSVLTFRGFSLRLIAPS